MTTVIETERLTKIFGHQNPAVSNLSISVPEGSCYGFLGPNGAGKTTTIKMLLGLVIPTAGHVKVFGEGMRPDSSHLRSKIGYLPTNPMFPPHMKPIQYLDYSARLFGMIRETRYPRVSELLRAVNLLSATATSIKDFSTGMTTRLGIAASLINDPELLIYDEPTLGLDPGGRASTLALIKELAKEKTVFLASHILGDVERVCSHVGVINDGKLIYEGTTRDLKDAIRKNSVNLELEGDIHSFLEGVRGLPAVVDVEVDGFRVSISFVEGCDYTKTLISVLEIAAAGQMAITSISSETATLEDAFLALVDREESRGILRAL
ncbi:MAG: ATP-binding cassette domain-containing protein [Thermoplasmata archaeon]